MTSPGERPSGASPGTYGAGALFALPVAIPAPTPLACARSLLENGIVIAKSQCGRARNLPRSHLSFSTERTMSVLCQLTERVSALEVGSSISTGPPGPGEIFMESLILAQDERWRRA